MIRAIDFDLYDSLLKVYSFGSQFLISAMMSARELTKAVIGGANRGNYHFYLHHCKIAGIVDRACSAYRLAIICFVNVNSETKKAWE